MYRFGTQTPVAVCQHNGKVYAHQLHQELAQPARSKNAQKRSFTEVDSERRSLVVEASTLLKSPKMQGKKDGPLLLAALSASCENMRQSMAAARQTHSHHAYRNCRREYMQAKKLQQQVASHIAPPSNSEEILYPEYIHDGAKTSVKFTQKKAPSEVVFQSLASTKLPARDAIVQEYLMQRLGKRFRPSGLNHTIVNCYAPCMHTGVTNGPAPSSTNNQFAVLPSEVPAPRPDELQQQLQRLQAQMSGLERQLRGREAPKNSHQEGGSFVPQFRPRQPTQWNRWNHHQRFQQYQGRASVPQWHPRVPQQGIVSPQCPAHQSPQHHVHQLPQHTTHQPAPAPRVRHQTPQSLSNTGMRPRAQYMFNENQRRRERRRRARCAMYVQVRVRADGRIYPDNERVTVRVAPALEQNPRYNFLVEQLAPRPRQNEKVVADGKPVASDHVAKSPATSVPQTTSEGSEKKSSGEDISDSDREPPLATQELMYSSKDEIVPNPKACFVPRSDVQGGHRVQGTITVATRLGANTRLKMSAHQWVERQPSVSDEEGHYSSGSESSSSLEARSNSPQYCILAHSLLLGEEVNMTNENKLGGDGKTNEKQPVNPSGTPQIQLPPGNTNEHPSTSKIPAECEKTRDREIDELKGHMNQLMSMMAKLTAGQFQAPPPNPPPQEDPQIEEIEGAPYVIPRFPYMVPDTSKGVTVNAIKIPLVLDANRPPVATLKDYQDIAEDIINKEDEANSG
ncbi:hypothetical protein BS78_K123700 [Paspalum vaginatum]|uniref:Uncharacterized protein n=1 Tax=Paspalum vaginatum TaxID=158149 RepID=A0A9W7XC22_9POAL|nr:hypothetical protein BS78_K123700 [Paspalum vaginatum]